MSLNGYRSRFSCFVGSSGVLGGGVGGANCNFSVYSDGVETIKIPFVSCLDNQLVPSALPLKVHTYTTDEFLITEEQVSTSEVNTNLSGTLELNYRETPSYNDSVLDVYHTAEALSNFRNQPPLMGLSSVCGTNQLMYFTRTGFGEDIFKYDKEWGISIYFYGAGTFYICGRGASGSNGTTIWKGASGNFYVSVGGVDLLIETIDNTKVHHVFWQNYHNGTTWVDDLWLDGVQKFSNRSTNRGTTNSDAPASIGGKYNVISVTDPINDAISGVGGEYNGIRISNTKLLDRQISGLFYRHKKYFAVPVGGDSIAYGQNGTPYWWQTLRDNSETYNYRIQWLNTAVPGKTFYSGMPVTPSSGFAVKPPWVIDSRPTPEATQSCEYMIEAFDPDKVIISFSSNFTFNDYTNYNPSGTGSNGEPSTLGYGNAADEFLYGHKAMEAKYAEYDIPMIWTSTHPISDTTLKTVDNIPRNEVHAIVSDTIEADPYITNCVIINRSLREGETSYDFKAEYLDDGVHPNTAGHAKDAQLIQSVSDYQFRRTRDEHFDSEVYIQSPVEGGIVISTPTEVTWYHDGIKEIDEENLVLGSNTIERSYTNLGGRISSDSINVTYSLEPQFGESTRYLMSQIVGSKFLDISQPPQLDANVFGTETITGNRWDLTTANSDYAYTIDSKTKMNLFESWAISIFIERKDDTTTTQYIVGKMPNTTGKRLNLYVVNNILGMNVEGSFVSLENPFGTIDGRTHIGIQNRYTGTEWVIDYYRDGAYQFSSNSRGNNPANQIEIMFGAASFSDNDPESGTGGHFNGYLDNYRYFDKVLTAQDWSDLYDNDV